MRARIISPLRPKAFHAPRGEKQVYLPNFVLTLLRTPHSPPHFASFLTPLYLNKLDLKDYLWHAYGLQVLGVRSYVIQARVRGADQRNRKFFRPRATKKMTVELVRNAPSQGPFVWPDPPTDFAPWSKSIYHTARKAQEKASERRGPQADRLAPTDGRTIAEQAKALREGRARWVPGWVDYGGARVVVGEEGGGGGEEGGGGEKGRATDAGWSYGRTGNGDASR